MWTKPTKLSRKFCQEIFHSTLHDHLDKKNVSSIRRLGSVSVCTELFLKNSQASSFHVHLVFFFLLVLVPSVGFSSIIVSGGFSVSRCMRLWETDLLNLLIFDDAFVWTLSNCVRSVWAIWASRRSSWHIISGFCSASSIHANNAVHHWIHIAVVGTMLTATASQHIPCLHKTPKKDRENDTSSTSGINTMGNWCLFYHVQQIRVSSSALCEVLNYLEAIENRQF